MKEVWRIKIATLFGKYHICSILGQTEKTTVFLVKHIRLNSYRAIKRVRKNQSEPFGYQQEANVLKSLSHPGIPIIYDVEEDEEYYYLIEEYLEGESIFSHVSRWGSFSKADTINYGIQICRLVFYLHFAKPNPILFLDIQPKNLLLCNDVVKLIDFEHAIYLGKKGIPNRRYGTLGCVAPELNTGEALDQRTDIYAIGTVLYFMLTGNYTDFKLPFLKAVQKEPLMAIIKNCMQKNKDKRYQTAEELCTELECVKNRYEESNKKYYPSLSIAIIGAKPGVGTTHIAISLTSYLVKQGIIAIYREENQSNSVKQLAESFQRELEQDGSVKMKSISMFPKYGSAVQIQEPSYDVRIDDWGCTEQVDDLEAYQLVLFVCSGKPWDWEFNEKIYQKVAKIPQVCVVFNLFSNKLKIKNPGINRDTPILQMPFFSNPFELSKEAKTVFHQVQMILQIEHKEGKKFGRKRKTQ